MESHEWYCPHCDIYTNNVYGEKNNDPRHIPCMQPVDSALDPNEGSYDTLEEKALAGKD